MKRLLVTTPIFYCNGAPHLGHASTVVLADAYARFLRMRGEAVLFSTGTDEHGSKVEKAAVEADMNVADFCDQTSAKFERLALALDSSHNVFVRTTSEKHKKTVAHLWELLRPLIRKGRYEGYYSQPDEMFVPLGRTQLHADGVRRISIESGHVLEWLEEDTYEFPLSEFGDSLRQWASSGEASIVPLERQREALQQMMTAESLSVPLSISRASNRSSWGVQVPSDADSTIYVWLDALANYLTVAGFDGTPESIQDVWPPHTQVIGKEILRFHAVYWPAFLFGAGLKPPRRLVCHGHWTVEGRKMSKSLGNVLDPFEIIQEFGSDAVRYFLLSEMNLGSDSSYSPVAMRERSYADLADTLGNLIKRCTAKSLNPEQAIPSRPQTVDQAGRELLAQAGELNERVSLKIEDLDFRGAVNDCMDVVRQGNRYWDETKPWTLRKRPEELKAISAITLETVRIVMTCLQPVIPRASDAVLSRMGINAENRGLDATKLWAVDASGNELNFGDYLLLAKSKS